MDSQQTTTSLQQSPSIPATTPGVNRSQPVSWGQKYPVAANFAASGISVSSGVALTNWIDVIKIRQQLSGSQGRNVLSTGIDIVKNEGPLALFKGVTPAIARAISHGGLRIGLYKPIKNALAAEGKEVGLLGKISAGMASGSIAAGICNPTDLVKTRMQAAGVGKAVPLAVTAAVIKNEGIKGLWKGTTPSMARSSLNTAAQCATYDEVKKLFIHRLGWEDGISTHFAVSGVVGLVTTTVIAPVDMVKTNMYVNPSFNGPWDCVKDIVKRLGVRGLFKGWSASWMRQGPMTTCIFVVYEATLPILGLNRV